MKISYIIILIAVSIGIGIIFSSTVNTSQYATFELAAKNEGKSYHVVGTLEKGKPMFYDPIKDPNHFEFYMLDSLKEERKVIYHSPKPQDFERTQSIVVKGYIEKDVFIAKEILLKCPSKYNDVNVDIEAPQTSL